MKTIALSLVLMAFSTAFAAPPKKLSSSDLQKIVDARRAALPAVDRAKTARCQPMLDAYNKDPEHGDEQLVDAARCFSDAGAVAAAISSWQVVVKYMPSKPAAKEATRALGDLYERAADFPRAAEWDENYWAHYPSEPDAKQVLTRAACIRFQLGDNEHATRDVKSLRGDAATLCDAIRPIEMPKRAP